MSDFFHGMTTHRCAKRRPCIWCGEMIEQGQIYCRQSGVLEGDFFTNHYHPECYDALGESDVDEFSPYDNQRPPSPGDLEFDSWDCTALAQGSLL